MYSGLLANRSGGRGSLKVHLKHACSFSHFWKWIGVYPYRSVEIYDNGAIAHHIRAFRLLDRLPNSFLYYENLLPRAILSKPPPPYHNSPPYTRSLKANSVWIRLNFNSHTVSGRRHYYLHHLPPSFPSLKKYGWRGDRGRCKFNMDISSFYIYPELAWKPCDAGVWWRVVVVCYLHVYACRIWSGALRGGVYLPQV